MTKCHDQINLYGVNIDIANTELSAMPDEFIGAHVVVYVPCKTLKEALDKAEEAILKENYEIQRMHWAKVIHIEEWDDSDEAFPTGADMQEAIEKGVAIFSSYFCYSEIDET